MSEFAIKHLDTEQFYTVESYDPKASHILRSMGVKQLSALVNGDCFELTPAQLAAFITRYHCGSEHVTRERQSGVIDSESRSK